ncbi:hypothetical protein DEJ51_03175 [Streptomyces venezuelae]|uniref:Uncharacterized protein n=1 Tax=Streptomyces venezuelae TaxID=54571 RepID=A0A5P2DGM7_STRVZ|nr:hypothetical protein [Streptomyces venezuelae]QES53377.1 hypothetical protein DEJ51_03175 [Streptomyces venezuelae]
MSEIRVLGSRALRDKDFEHVTLPEPWMSASGREFVHQDPDVEAFRRTVPIYCGDFDLTVTCLERKNARDVGFERFVANCLRDQLHGHGGADPEDASTRFHFRAAYDLQQLAGMVVEEEAAAYVASLPYGAPIEVLWDFSNFGCLRWDWLETSVRLQGRPVPGTGGVHAPAVDGSEFLPRIFSHAEPDVMHQDVHAIREHALGQLKYLPDLREGLPRDAMAKLINEDILALSALCHRHGTFGEAVLPGAFDPITGFFLKARDGNSRQAFIETGEYFYEVLVSTS